MRVYVIFLQLIVLYSTAGSGQNATTQAVVATAAPAPEVKGIPIVEKKTAAKYDNPNYVRDRLKELMFKPQHPPMTNRFKKPYHPEWQDYCNPTQCNTHNKIACGLHRKNMRFQWFQSLCHLILNNQCANYRGALKYDAVETKYCQAYVMFLRDGCTTCDDDDDDVPVCGVSRSTSHVVLFKNRCAMDKENCDKESEEYQEVQMFLCEFYLHWLVK